MERGWREEGVRVGERGREQGLSGREERGEKERGGESKEGKGGV